MFPAAPVCLLTNKLKPNLPLLVIRQPPQDDFKKPLNTGNLMPCCGR